MSEGINKTYADYLRQGNNVNPEYIMPPEARPPFEATPGDDAPNTARQRARTTVDYIRLAEKREASYSKGIRNEIVRDIQSERSKL